MNTLSRRFLSKIQEMYKRNSIDNCRLYYLNILVFPVNKKTEKYKIFFLLTQNKESYTAYPL